MPFVNRFRPTHDLVEWAGNYNPGGFHPVHFGELFNCRYRVCRKLGYGVYSTVWLARDEKLKTFVALKVGTATSATTPLTNERDILRQLPKSSEPSRANIPTLLDAFIHVGPNGSHPCLVLPALGRPFSLLVQKTLVPGADRGLYSQKHWTARFTREAARQLVQAVQCLHSHEIMHRDLKLDNVLLTLPQSFADKSPADVNADTTSSLSSDPPTVPLVRLDDQPLDNRDGDPPYLAPAMPLADDLTLNPPPTPLAFTLQLIDYGAACTFASANDGLHAYSYALRPPELVLSLPIGPPADVWALGLVIYQLVTLSNLWPSSSYEDTAEEADDELLSRMVSRFGRMPDGLRERWANSGDFLDEKGEELPDLDDEGEPLNEEEEAKRQREALLGQVLARAKPVGMGQSELKAFEDFLTLCLKWEAKDRATPEELLSSQWLRTDWDEGQES